MSDTEANTAADKRAQARVQAVTSFLNRIEERRKEWFLPVLLMLVRDGLESLRGYLEDPTETEITWADPVVELRWPIRWEWERWEREGLVWAGPEPEDLVRLAETMSEDTEDRFSTDFMDLIVLNTRSPRGGRCRRTQRARSMGL
jgi:hypothetical protein